MSDFKPMIKMETTEPGVELKLKKGGSAHHKKHHAHHEHHEHHGKKAVKKAMGGGLPVEAPGVTGRRMSPRMAAMMGHDKMAAPMMKKGGAASEAEMKKLRAELKKHEHMKARKAHHGLKEGGTTGQAIPADTNKKHGGRMHKFAKGGPVKEGGIEASFAHDARMIDDFGSRSAIENDAKQYLNTLMHTAVADRTKGGTGEIHKGNAAGYKKGGKVHEKHHEHKEHHKEGGMHEMHEHLAKAHHHAMKCAEGGSSHHERMMKHHMKKAQMCMGGYKDGGAVKEKHGSEVGTITGNAGEYLNTKHNTAHPDHTKGPTGIVKMGQSGYKKGGEVTHHEVATRGVGKKVHKEAHGRKFESGAIMGDHPLAGKRSGTSSETVAQPHQWEFGNVVGTRPGASGTTTGEVKNGQGGFKHGGRTVKKHYASGGSVNDSGAPEEMLQGKKPPSPFVSINELSGTFKKGGKVHHRVVGGKAK